MPKSIMHYGIQTTENLSKCAYDSINEVNTNILLNVSVNKSLISAVGLENLSILSSDTNFDLCVISDSSSSSAVTGGAVDLNYIGSYSLGTGRYMLHYTVKKITEYTEFAGGTRYVDSILYFSSGVAWENALLLAPRTPNAFEVFTDTTLRGIGSAQFSILTSGEALTNTFLSICNWYTQAGTYNNKICTLSTFEFGDNFNTRTYNSTSWLASGNGSANDSIHLINSTNATWGGGRGFTSSYIAWDIIYRLATSPI